MIEYICQNPDCPRKRKSFIGKNVSHKYKYCSYSCAGHITGKINGKIGGKIGGKNAQKTLKRLKKGIYDPKVRSKGGKIGVKKTIEFNRRNRIGACYNKQVQSLAGKKSAELRKNTKIGIYGMSHEQHVQAGKIGGEISKKAKIGVFGMTHEQHVNAGSKAIKQQRKKLQKPIYCGVKFDSLSEVGLAKELKHKYLWFPKQNKNVHITIGHKEFDFLVRNTFIDYHVFCVDKTLQQYYEERKHVLNENGFKNSNYIVLSNLKNFDKLTLNKEGLI